jgi:hypothetical protein
MFLVVWFFIVEFITFSFLHFSYDNDINYCLLVLWLDAVAIQIFV